MGVAGLVMYLLSPKRSKYGAACYQIMYRVRAPRRPQSPDSVKRQVLRGEVIPLSWMRYIWELAISVRSAPSYCPKMEALCPICVARAY